MSMIFFTFKRFKTVAYFSQMAKNYYLTYIFNINHTRKKISKYATGLKLLCPFESMWFKGVTLFCRCHAYADTWLNGVTLFCRRSAYTDTWLNGVTLFCRRSAYADIWINTRIYFVGVAPTPTRG